MHRNGLKNKMVLTQGLSPPLRRARCLLTFSFWKCCCCTCFCVITKGLSWIWFICLAALCVWIFAIIPATGGSRIATPTWEGSFGRYLQLLATRQTFFSVGEPACQWANLLCLAGQSWHSAKRGTEKPAECRLRTDKLLLATTWTKHDRRIQPARATSVGK